MRVWRDKPGSCELNNQTFEPPISFEMAAERAGSILKELSLDEKLNLIGGEKGFFIKGLKRFGFPDILMADASMGVNFRSEFLGKDLGIEAMEKSTAFPCTLMLAATWNPALAYRYAEAIGEECRAGGVAVLLGPGLNLYRISQCGRNFEYFGEDPFLISRMIENYVLGLQSTGTIATLKHFVTNNSDFFRRRSNSIVDERTLREIYLQGFKAGIDAGAMAVMTSYNLLNGEWAGQSGVVIQEILRTWLGFKWLVMTDWWSVYDGENLIRSGQDLEMPAADAVSGARSLLEEGKIEEVHIDRMVQSILTTVIAMGLYDRPAIDKTFYGKFTEHEAVALQTAREGIVLLRNEGVLPVLSAEPGKILVTGKYVETIAEGGGAATVQGYDQVNLLKSLQDEFGEAVQYIPDPSDAELKSADLVLVNTGTDDSEGWDRSFDLPEAENTFILNCLSNNPNSVVLVHSGSGINMSPWHEKAGAILYTWYKGQIGNRAVAEILSGKTNPSGKLPITIEKKFEDSPGFGYLPGNEQLYTGWNDEVEKDHPVFDVLYDEGIFVGYRWYEHKGIEPLFPFGYGLSYTQFDYLDITISPGSVRIGVKIRFQVQVTIRNAGDRAGAEIVQVYIRDCLCSVPRPEKELKGFAKILLEPGETGTVDILLESKAFSFWDSAEGNWIVEPGLFEILAGPSSKTSLLSERIEIAPA